MTARILVVDDHAAVQRGVEEILSTNLPDTYFGHARTAQEALDSVQRERWDIAVIDLNLPGRGGLELIRTLKDAQPRMHVLVYSMYPEDQFGVRALRAGADGYLTKDSPAEEIPKAVRSILDGGRYIGPSLAAAMAQTIVGGNEEPVDLLSDREYQVLKKMASGRTPSEIAQDFAVSIKTVSTYRGRILEKLNLRTSADLIRYAVEHGIADV